jgi:hypothetical protein
MFTEQSSFAKHLEFQFQQHKQFVFVCVLVFFGIIFGAILLPKESKHSLLKNTPYKGVKDRHFTQHQVLNIIRLYSTKKPQIVEKIQNPTYTQFVKYVTRNKPFILTGVMESWGAYKNWNDDYLKSKIGDVELLVESSENNQFYGGSNYVKMQIKDFLEVYAKEGRSTNYYVAEGNMEKFQALKTDFPDRLNFVPRSWNEIATQMWIGAGDQVTPMHQDEVFIFILKIKKG